jgi:AAA+ ATPase superfamily predicted ATPase
VYEINVERFSKEKSKEFLKKGFQEEVELELELIEKAIEFFDGIISWLVIFGREYIDGINNMEKIKENAINLALNELKKLKSREKMVLKAIETGSKKWSNVKNYIN